MGSAVYQALDLPKVAVVIFAHLTCDDNTVAAAVLEKKP
jgi:hypothetical protein